LYFRAALYGTFLFILAYGLRLGILAICPWYASFEEAVAQQIIPLLKPTVGAPPPNPLGIVLTCFYALMIGVFAPAPLNLLFRQDRFLERAVQDNDFERLIHNATANDSPLSVTIESQKVYVGYVAKSADPSQARKHIGLMPVMSGYRHADGRVEFTTFYSDVYEEIARGDVGRLSHLAIEDFEIVIPIDKIQSANMFDIVAYEEFGRAHAAATEPTAVPKKENKKKKSQ
jgi:hypothetical protein